MPRHRAILVCLFLTVALAAGLWWRNRSSLEQAREAPSIVIDKQPVAFATRTFNPASPPADMPPMSAGDAAECDSNFICNASVRGQAHKIDATHATVTIEQIKVTLQLNLTIWLPVNANPQVSEHEDGHSQISRAYYETADKVARQVAAAYAGNQIDIGGVDLNAEADRALGEAAAAVDAEFNKQFDPGPTQQYYDTITDHGRNGMVVKDAVAAALRDNGMAPIPPVSNSGN